VVILGLMGAGKSTLAKGLAAHLGWPVSDSDDYVERKTGRTARQVLEASGSTALHRVEATHLLEALKEPGPVIVCAAASVVENAACRAVLANPVLPKVWLRGSAQVLASRFRSSEHRPAYGRDPVAFLSRQIAHRDALFEACNPLVVDIDGKTADEICAETMAGLTSLPHRDVKASQHDQAIAAPRRPAMAGAKKGRPEPPLSPGSASARRRARTGG
jgi:shikimate kinase